MPNKIALPPEGEGLQVVASVSGGKDSTALILALREAEIPARYVFADTQWEAPETYEYLDTLRAKLGITIEVVGVEGGMVRKSYSGMGFPRRMHRWCTRELKIQPIKRYHEQIRKTLGVETINAVGVRAQESFARSKLADWELEEGGHDAWDGWVWRPLIAWTIQDVLGIHARHGVPVNPLYRLGFDRVGCFPCIFSSKEEIALLAQHAPSRIDEIERLEIEHTVNRIERNKQTPGRYASESATFFQTRDAVGPMGIRQVVDWARTDRGGKQLPIFAPAPRGGCMRWGLCDVSTTQTKDDPDAP